MNIKKIFPTFSEYENERVLNESKKNMTDKQLEKLKEKWDRWNKLVNMSASELEKFMDSQFGKKAGLKKKEASKLGISTGRESARAILRMMKKGNGFKSALENWNSTDWKWCGKQISFISRMSGNSGPLYDKDNKPTRKLLSLKIWGHNPSKK
jgi:hypothetical protein